MAAGQSERSLAALRARLGPDVTVVAERGVTIDKTMPAIAGDVEIEFFALDDLGGEVLHRQSARHTEMIFVGSPAPIGPKTATADVGSAARPTVISSRSPPRWDFSSAAVPRAIA